MIKLAREDGPPQVNSPISILYFSHPVMSREKMIANTMTMRMVSCLSDHCLSSLFIRSLVVVVRVCVGLENIILHTLFYKKNIEPQNASPVWKKKI